MRTTSGWTLRRARDVYVRPISMYTGMLKMDGDLIGRRRSEATTIRLAIHLRCDLNRVARWYEHVLCAIELLCEGRALPLRAVCCVSVLCVLCCVLCSVFVCCVAAVCAVAGVVLCAVCCCVLSCAVWCVLCVLCCAVAVPRVALCCSYCAV